MIDTPYVNDGADTSLRKTVSLLNKIEAKTGATTITGPVTVSNEVEVTNSSGSPIPVSGSVSVSNLPATQPISGSVSVSNFPATQPISGSVTASPAQGTTVTNSNFTSITPSTSLVSAVAGRRVLSVFNEGTGVLYISGGGTCTSASYQIRLGVNEYWEAPAGQLSLAHSAVFGTTGTARVSQVT